VLLLYPLFHPVPSLVLGLILLTLWIPFKFHDFWDVFHKKNRNFSTSDRMNAKGAIPFLFLIIWSIFWYSFYSMWGYTITEVYQTILSEGGPSSLKVITENVNYAQFYGYDVVGIFLKTYANLLFLSILSVISFLILWKMVSNEQKKKYMFSLYGPFGVLCILIPVLFLFNLPFSPLRLIFYISILETVFVAYLVSFVLTHSRERKGNVLVWLTNIFVVIVLVGLFLSGILSLYPSPYNLSVTPQTTKSEVFGMKYFFEYRDVTIPVSGFHTAVGRFANLLLSPQERSVHHLPLYLEDKDRPPWHFGYDQFPSIASSYHKETNLIITQRDKLLYSDYYPNMAEYRLTTRDFERLNHDSGASLLYSNGGFDILTILPSN
jgi:hypothetical protein